MKKLNEYTDLDALANAGWQQMHSMLDEKMPSKPLKKPRSFLGKFRWPTLSLLIIVAVIMVWRIATPPVATPSYKASSEQAKAKELSKITENGLETPNEFATISPGIQEPSFETQKQVQLPGIQGSEPSNKAQTDGNTPAIVNTSVEKIPVYISSQTIEEEGSNTVKEFSAGTGVLRTSLPLYGLKKKAEKASNVPALTMPLATTKSSGKQHERWNVYVGGMFNFSGNNALSLEKTSLHPTLQIQYRLANQWSIHSGLGFFSTLHSRYRDQGEKEYVNNMITNTYYRIRTTSVVKVGYFDLPIYLQYHLNRAWTIGGGVQISRLHRMQIQEQEDNFDYANNLTTTNSERFTSDATLFGGYQEKIEASRWDTRLVFQTTYETGRLRFRAGYANGVKPSVIMLQRDGSKLKYRNTYFQAGIEWRLK